MSFPSHRTPLAAVAVALLLAGCRGGKDAASATATATPAPTFIALPEGSLTPPDHSLTPSDYVAKGMPAADRTWSDAEMKRAATAVAGMAGTADAPLPRFRSPRSGAMFARMTAAQNLDLFRTNDLDADTRFGMAADYFGSGNDILMTYVNAFSKGAVGGAELLELMSADFRAAAALLDLGDKTMAGIKPGDESAARRRAGYEKMRSGIASMLAGGLTSIGESRNYTVDDRRRFIGSMIETFPGLLAHLSSDSRQDTMNQVASLLADSALTELRPDLLRLQQAIAPAGSTQ